MDTTRSRQGFLAELYLDVGAGRDAIRRAHEAADAMGREGRPVRYVRSVEVPGDEMVLVFLEADSTSTVAELGRRAGLRFDRIVATSEP